MSKPAALYRLYDAEDHLLYVGVANRPEARWRTHECEKRWWPDVARKTVEWHPDRETAEAAEAQAILTESPLYNIMLPSEDGGRRMRRDAPPQAWHHGRPHWEVRYGAPVG